MKKSEIILVVLVLVLAAVLVMKIFTSRNEVREQVSLVAERDATIAALTQRSSQQEALSTNYQALLEQKDTVLQQTIVLYAQEKQRADQLVTKATKLAETHAREQSKLQKQINTCSVELAQMTAKCDTLAQDLDEAERHSATRLTLVHTYEQYVSNLEPHLAWLQNEAGRDWWKKFWDRGKLSKPATPFPTPPVLPATY